jgi:hypothetical protein
MDQRIALLPPRWSDHLPGSIAWLEFKERCFSYARKLTGHTHANNQGLTPRLLSQAAYVAKFGVQPALHEDPGDYPEGADGAAIADHKELKEVFKFQRQMDPVLESNIEGSYPPHIRAMMEVNFSLDHLTLAEQFVRLDGHLPILAADIAWLQNQISTKWDRNESIEACTARQIQNLAYLNTAGQAPSSLQAIQWMWAAFTTTAQDRSDFISCMVRFREQRPLLAAQTPVNFGASVVTYVNNLLPAEREANVARRQANAVTEIPGGAAGDEPDQMMVFMALYARDPAAATAMFNRRSAAPAPAPAAAPVAAAAPAAAKKKQPPYCHTCGVPRNPAHHHPSDQCKTKAPGHRNDATFKNQLGGRPAY